MQKTFKRVLAVGLSAMLAISSFSISASAYNKDYQSQTHTVFRHTEQTLAPGVEYYNNYAYLNDGNQIVYYVATADINRDDVIVQGAYKNAGIEELGMSKLTEQAAAANAKFSDPNNEEFISENYTVVAGTNGDFYNMSTGQPSGAFAINGKIMNNANNRPWFAIFEDGTALCGANNADYNAAIAEHGAVQNSVGGSQMLVVNGADVTATSSGDYNTERHSRTMIGVTADNKVVCTVLDGRQAPFSIGGSMHELAQIMIEADCVTAINLDGGGSTTFGMRPEGEDEFKIVNRPSDGSERSISSGVVIASLAAPSNVFDRVSMTVADEYVTPGTSTALTVAGVSTSGSSAEIPAEVTYEATNGTVADGVFTAGSTAGDAVITAKYNGNVVGTATVHVVIPDSIEFNAENITVPYGKSTEFTMVAKYGLNEVANKSSDFDFVLENAGAGTIANGVFTAAEESSGIESTGISATFIADPTKTAQATLLFGKGSDVVADFEEGRIIGGSYNDFWLNDGNYNYIVPKHSVEVVDKDHGQVHSGNYSLRCVADYSNSTEGGYMRISLAYGGPDVVMRDAKRLGMWMYIPDEWDSLWMRYMIFPATEDAEGNLTYSSSFTGQDLDGVTNGAATGFVSQFDEPGWHYFSIDLSNYPITVMRHNYYVIQYYISDRDNTAFNYDHNNYKNFNTRSVFYIDDVTVDYSDVIDDREAPVFSNVLLGDRGPHSNDALALDNGYVSDGYNQISLSARVAENTAKNNYTGISAASAKAQIDGNEVAVRYENGLMSLDEYTFADGYHTVRFEIADNAGNTAHITRNFTVSTGGAPAVKLVPHDASLDRIKFGSLYNVDVVATAVETIRSVSVDIDLDNISKWELAHMDVAKGFEATYTVEDDDNVATINITKTGEVTATGEAALVSMPIRTWQLDPFGTYNYKKFRSGNEVAKIAIFLTVDRGTVTFTDGTVDFFSNDKIQVDSESIYDYKSTAAERNDGFYQTWNGGHEHRPEWKDAYNGLDNYTEPRVTKAAQAPTCTEDGWTAELYCDVCNSIVQWSEPIPATGHNYEMGEPKAHFIISDNGENQSPDLDFNGGAGYYYDNAEYKSYETDGNTRTITFTKPGSFKNDPTIYVWFDGIGSTVQWPGTAMTYSGNNDYGEPLFTFDIPEAPERMMCATCGELCNEEVNGVLYEDGVTVQGFKNDKYYIDGVAQPYTGIVKIDDYYYEFDENGNCLGKYTGLIDIDGVNYYSKFGELSSGWFDVDGDWYYFMPDTFEGANGIVKNDVKVAFEFENGKLLSGKWEKTIGKYRYWFGPDYYHIVSRNVPYLVQEVEGDTYLFDGGGYRATGIVSNHESNDRTLNWYDCGEDGKAAKLNGPRILDYNGKLYYVDENGDSPAGKGLVKIGSDYYYVLYDGSVKRNGDRVVEPEKTNDLLPTGTYNFDENGKITNVPVINGVGEDFYYRENGEIVPGKGLVKVGDDYYYVLYNGKVKRNDDRVVEPDKTNDLLPTGTYHFGEDGKMTTLLNGVDPYDFYYREDGVIQKGKGLVKIDDDYYYVLYNGKVKRDGDRVVEPEKTNNLLPAGTYNFDAEGKITNVPVLDGVGEDFYYRENGEIVPGKGLVKVGDDYYYVLYNGKVKRNDDRVVEPEKTNDLLPTGTYHFGEDGKMTTLLNGVDPYDFYYRENGVIQKGKGLIKIEGDYYYVLYNGKVKRNGDRVVEPEKTNDLLPAGTYSFDEYGKIIDPPVILVR